MFYQYEIKNINGEEILYLYMTFKYEFSKEFQSFTNNQIQSITNDYININHIPFRGNKIYYVIDGIIVKKMNRGTKYIKDNHYSADDYRVRLKKDDNSYIEVTLREYLLSGLLSFYSDLYGKEVLKCICILLNTYVYYSMKKENFVFIHSPFFSYQVHEEHSLYPLFNQIIDECQGMYLAYNGDYILPFIHLSNYGYTTSNRNYPYLSSVKCLWDIQYKDYLHTYHFSYSELSKYLNLSKDINQHSSISITKNHVKIDGIIFTIPEIRKRLHLSSDNFVIIMNHDDLTIITRGNGSAMGLSLYGASFIEKNDGKFHQILSYFFPKCRLFQHVKRLSS